jgi:hypothetical protein
LPFPAEGLLDSSLLGLCGSKRPENRRKCWQNLLRFHLKQRFKRFLREIAAKQELATAAGAD